MIRQSTKENIVLGNLQVFGIKTAKLHKANRIIPLGISIYRHIDIKLARLVSKVRLQFAIVPSFQILAKRSLQQKMEVLVSSTETESKERIDAFLVIASRFKRNAESAPIFPIIFGSIHSKNGIRRATIKAKIEIGPDLKIANLFRRLFRNVFSRGKRHHCHQTNKQ